MALYKHQIHLCKLSEILLQLKPTALCKGQKDFCVVRRSALHLNLQAYKQRLYKLDKVS